MVSVLDQPVCDIVLSPFSFISVPLIVWWDQRHESDLAVVTYTQ
jgi:hypothetical protein